MERRPNFETVAVSGGPYHSLDPVHCAECPGRAADLHQYLSLPVCVQELTHRDRKVPPLRGEVEAAGGKEGLNERGLMAKLRLQPIANFACFPMVFNVYCPAAIKVGQQIPPDALCVRGCGEAVIHAQPQEHTVGDGALPLGRAGCC